MTNGSNTASCALRCTLYDLESLMVLEVLVNVPHLQSKCVCVCVYMLDFKHLQCLNIDK